MAASDDFSEISKFFSSLLVDHHAAINEKLDRIIQQNNWIAEHILNLETNMSALSDAVAALGAEVMTVGNSAASVEALVAAHAANEADVAAAVTGITSAVAALQSINTKLAADLPPPSPPVA
jgi:uncharacterized protein YoxC